MPDIWSLHVNAANSVETFKACEVLAEIIRNSKGRVLDIDPPYVFFTPVGYPGAQLGMDLHNKADELGIHLIVTLEHPYPANMNNTKAYA